MFVFMEQMAAASEVETDESRYQACLEGLMEDPAHQLQQALRWYSDGGGAAARHCQAMARYVLGQYVQAAKELGALAEAVRLGEGLGAFAKNRKDVLKWQLYAQEGEAWLSAGHYDKAYSALTAALMETVETERQRASLLWARAIASGQRKAYDIAVVDLTAAIVLRPERIDFYLLRGQAYRDMRQFDAAMGDIQHILSQQPDHGEALLERGIIYRLTGETPLALADWQQVVDLYPQTPLAAKAAENIRVTRH
ncbi:MAG: hypothetical protein CMF31_05305 [Kordiimonas sp.]|nr:hypothetical protein [Kordiimonas sp.]